MPDDVLAKHKTYNYRIRQYSNSVVPNSEQEAELIQLTAKIPFDDRVNSRANIDDLSFALMREHLSKTKSKLYTESISMTTEELARAMNLCEGTKEHLFPKNIGLLMFSENPKKFFPGVQIDVVEFPYGIGAKEFNEKTFEVAIQKQLTDALSYLKTNVIKGKVKKYADREQSDKIYNYPYDALEEALANAVYHRNYELRDPIEVRVLPDAIEIISYNGVDPSLKQADFEKGIIRIRRYRNRRIGEFLKELDLTEGRGTGIPTIINAMKNNGSHPSIFETDEPERRYFVCELPLHPAYKNNSNQVSNQVSKKGLQFSIDSIMLLGELPDEKSIAKYSSTAKELSAKQKNVLEYSSSPKKKKEIMEGCLDLSNQTKNFNKYIEPLLKLKLLQRTLPNKPNSQHQKYFTTHAGKVVLYILANEKK